jgi:hypothetical protein
VAVKILIDNVLSDGPFEQFDCQEGRFDCPLLPLDPQSIKLERKDTSPGNSLIDSMRKSLEVEVGIIVFLFHQTYDIARCFWETEIPHIDVDWQGAFANIL